MEIDDNADVPTAYDETSGGDPSGTLTASGGTCTSATMSPSGTISTVSFTYTVGGAQCTTATTLTVSSTTQWSTYTVALTGSGGTSCSDYSIQVNS